MREKIYLNLPHIPHLPYLPHIPHLPHLPHLHSRQKDQLLMTTPYRAPTYLKVTEEESETISGNAATAVYASPLILQAGHSRARRLLKHPAPGHFSPSPLWAGTWHWQV